MRYLWMTSVIFVGLRSREMWPLSGSAWSACCPRGKSGVSTYIHQPVLMPLFSTPGYMNWSIESSSCIHSYPANLALCLVEALSCGTLPSWLIYGPRPQKSSPAVQWPLDKNKLNNYILNHLYVSFTVIGCNDLKCAETQVFLFVLSHFIPLRFRDRVSEL